MLSRKELYNGISDEEKAFNFAVELGIINSERRPCSDPGCEGTFFLEKGQNRHDFNGRYRCNKRGCRKVGSGCQKSPELKIN